MLNRYRELQRGWQIQGRNIHALMLRDLMMRYGRDNIGFAWVILEPMILTVGVMVVWTILGGAARDGVKIVDFLITGYMPLTLWRHVTNTMVALWRRSAPLLYHRTVSLFDIALARASLEFIGVSAAFMVVWGTLNIAGIASPIVDLGLVILGWSMMAWLGAAIGMLIASSTEYSETSEKFIQPFQYLLIPLCGAYVMVDWLPQWAHPFILLNPMVHCFEVLRAGYFGSSVTTHYSYTYFCAAALVSDICGVVCVQRARARVQLS